MEKISKVQRIVHIMLSCFYKEGYGYQENILPEKHSELGYDVKILTFRGKEHILPQDICQNNSLVSYLNKDSIEVVVLPSNKSILTQVPVVRGLLYRTTGLYEQLEKMSPDIIFVHGVYLPEYRELYKYVSKNPQTKLFVDNHSDYYNTPVPRGIHNVFLKNTIILPFIKKFSKYVSRFWGVTPWRVAYLREVFQIPEDKVGLLVMGGDDRFIRIDRKDEIREQIREKYNVPHDAFLIITGGKIDPTKNIHLLMEAVAEMRRQDIYLMVFGNYTVEMENVCNKLWNDHIINIGWLASEEVYDYFLSADLACFPGTHSVLWEQACACGLPAIFKDWDGGFRHVDLNGNCLILKDVTPESLKKAITEILTMPDAYGNMKTKAVKEGIKHFSYLEIAKRAINLE